MVHLTKCVGCGSIFFFRAVVWRERTSGDYLHVFYCACMHVGVDGRRNGPFALDHRADRCMRVQRAQAHVVARE